MVCLPFGERRLISHCIQKRILSRLKNDFSVKRNIQKKIENTVTRGWRRISLEVQFNKKPP